MGWKCAPQVMGLVRGEPKQGQKHRADIRKIVKEAGYERASRSDTLDRSRSSQNQYDGYRSGAKFADDMEAEAAEYRVKVNGRTKDGQPIVREKGLPHNAVIGWAVIYNPPAEVCADWTDEEYAKFHRDCQEVMAEIEPSLFRSENIRMTAEHFDEGVPPESESDRIDRHFHDLGVCKDADGHYCGNRIDAKLLIRINERFPSMMRDRGWDMEDLDTTDFDRAKTDKEYASERNAKRKKSGLSVNRHLKSKAKETSDQVAELLDQAVRLSDEANMRMQLAGDLMMEADAKEQYGNQIIAESKAKQKLIAEKVKAQEQREADFQKHEDALQAQQSVLDERAKAQEKKEAEFQVWEDSLDAQQAVLAEREAAIEKREQENQELILLGRKVKANQVSQTVQQTDRPERRLPNIDFDI